MSDRVLPADWPAPANIVAGTTAREGDESDLPAEPSWLQQVHGNRAVVLGSSDFDGAEPAADALTQVTLSLNRRLPRGWQAGGQCPLTLIGRDNDNPSICCIYE